MLTITANTRIFLFRNPVDLRRGFEGLSHAVEQTYGDILTSGSLFVFLNRRRDRMKVLYWDVDGLVIWYKRLEKGTYSTKNLSKSSMTRREFLMLLEGIIPKRIQHRHNMP